MKKIKELFLVLSLVMLVALLAPALQVSAAGTAYVYYVDEKGNDGKNGKTKENAFRHLYSAIAALFAMAGVVVIRKVRNH